MDVCSTYSCSVGSVTLLSLHSVSLMHKVLNNNIISISSLRHHKRKNVRSNKESPVHDSMRNLKRTCTVQFLRSEFNRPFHSFVFSALAIE